MPELEKRRALEGNACRQEGASADIQNDCTGDGNDYEGQMFPEGKPVPGAYGQGKSQTGVERTYSAAGIFYAESATLDLDDTAPDLAGEPSEMEDFARAPGDPSAEGLAEGDLESSGPWHTKRHEDNGKADRFQAGKSCKAESGSEGGGSSERVNQPDGQTPGRGSKADQFKEENGGKNQPREQARDQVGVLSKGWIGKELPSLVEKKSCQQGNEKTVSVVCVAPPCGEAGRTKP